MPTLSPLATLVETLSLVCHNARQNEPLLGKNEAATRATLIDPVLRALGWDTTNVRMVEPERTVENKQSLDYVLKGSNGTIQFVIEAKKLGESLDKLGHVGALIGYAFSLKPISFFITDGLNWHCYSPEHSHYKPVAIIELLADNLLPAALQLMQLLDAAHSGYGLPQLPNLINVASASVTSRLKNIVPKEKNQFRNTASHKTELPKTLSDNSFTELSQLSTLSLVPGQKPKYLRLPDGTVHQINTWKDILLEVCQFLLLHTTSITLPLPDKAGKKRFLLSVEKAVIGLSTSTSYQGKPIFIYTHYSATDCIANALYAEAQLPADQRKTRVAVAF